MEDTYLSISDKINGHQLNYLSGNLDVLNPVRYGNKEVLINYLTDLNKLEDSWDGYDATAPYTDSINNCIRFLDRIDNVINDVSVDNIIPSNYGTIILSLFNKYREKVVIEFGKTKIGFYSKFNDNENYEIEQTTFVYTTIHPDLISALTKLYKSYIF